MWTILFFDLAMKTDDNRKDYVKFRNYMLSLGFDFLQFSIYARSDIGEDRAASILENIKANLPPEGQVRLLQITDRQFGRMAVFTSGKQEEPEPFCEQLEMF